MKEGFFMNMTDDEFRAAALKEGWTEAEIELVIEEHNHSKNPIPYDVELEIGRNMPEIYPPPMD